MRTAPRTDIEKARRLVTFATLMIEHLEGAQPWMPPGSLEKLRRLYSLYVDDTLERSFSRVAVVLGAVLEPDGEFWNWPSWSSSDARWRQRHLNWLRQELANNVDVAFARVDESALERLLGEHTVKRAKGRKTVSRIAAEMILSVNALGQRKLPRETDGQAADRVRRTIEAAVRKKRGS